MRMKTPRPTELKWGPTLQKGSWNPDKSLLMPWPFKTQEPKKSSAFKPRGQRKGANCDSVPFLKEKTCRQCLKGQFRDPGDWGFTCWNQALKFSGQTSHRVCMQGKGEPPNWGHRNHPTPFYVSFVSFRLWTARTMEHLRALSCSSFRMASFHL